MLYLFYVLRRIRPENWNPVSGILIVNDRQRRCC
jgi:hypothetical protein